MIIDGKLVISKKKKKDLIVELKQKGFKAIPKVADAALAGESAPVVEEEEEEEGDVEIGSNAYDYLLGVCGALNPDISKANLSILLDGSLVPDSRAS